MPPFVHLGSMRAILPLVLAILLTVPMAYGHHAAATSEQTSNYVGPGDLTHTGGASRTQVGGQDFHPPAGATKAVVTLWDATGFPQSVLACQELDRQSCVRRVEFDASVVRGCHRIEVPIVGEAMLHVHVVSNLGAAVRGFGCGPVVPGPTTGTIHVLFE